MASSVYMIVLICWMVALLVFYHKIFTVYYFDLGHGLLKELGVSFILGLIMTALTFYFWWLTAIIIIIVGLSFKKKLSSNAPFIIAVVFAVIVAFLGISMKNEKVNDEVNYTQDEEILLKASVENPVEEGIEVEEEIEQGEANEKIEDSTGIVYGTYLRMPNGVGGYSNAEVGFYSDDSEDYISINSYEENESNSFSGVLQKDGDSYISTNEYGISYRITFTDNGMNVEMITGIPDYYDESFIGNYKLIDKLDLDAVS